MFAKDVSKYCKSNAGTAAITKCKHDLLTFGVSKLEKMEDSHLDAMDPFQRSANDISKYPLPSWILSLIYLLFSRSAMHTAHAPSNILQF